MILNPLTLIEKLEDELLYCNSKTKFCLKSKESDEVFHVGRAFFKQSKTLKDRTPFGENFEIEAAPATIQQFIEFKTNAEDMSIEEFTISDYLNMMALNSELGNNFYSLELLKQYLNNYAEPLPETCCPKIVLNVFDLVCSTPIREEQVYRDELKRIKIYAKRRADPSIVTDAFNIFRERMKRFDQEGIKLIQSEETPLSFHKFVVPLLLIRRDGEVEVYIMRGNQYVPTAERVHWLDGSLTDEKIDELYVRYNKFMLYRIGSVVWFKDLTDGTAPVKSVLERCSILINREHIVFAVIENSSSGSSIVRIDGDTISEVVIELSLPINHLDYNIESKVLVVAVETESDRKILFFKYEPFSLKPLTSNFRSPKDCCGLRLGTHRFYYFIFKDDSPGSERLAFDIYKIDDRNIYFDMAGQDCFINGFFIAGWYFPKLHGQEKYSADQLEESFGLQVTVYDSMCISEFCLLP